MHKTMNAIYEMYRGLTNMNISKLLGGIAFTIFFIGTVMLLGTIERGGKISVAVMGAIVAFIGYKLMQIFD